MARSKTFTIFAGVNGAGKSTLFAMDSSSDLGVRLNTDEIVKQSGADWRSTDAQILAGKKLLQLQKECFEQGLSCNRETTLCGNNILQSIKEAKELGYKIHLRYIGVENADIAIQRVQKRISLGGHGVSENTINHRYQNSAANFKKIVKLCDSVNIYDNSGVGMILAAYTVNGQIVKTDAQIEWVDNLLNI